MRLRDGAALIAAVMSSLGCGEGSPEPAVPSDFLGVVYTDSQGKVRTSREATYRFGMTFMGQRTAQKIVIRNLDKLQVSLEALEKVSGDPVQIAGVGDPDPVWDVAFEPGRTLGSSEYVEFEATFSPPQQDGAVVDHHVVLRLRARDARDGEQTASITLVGMGVYGFCELPAAIDFGTVAIGEAFRQSVAIDNPTPLSTTASIGDLESVSGDEGVFAFSAESPRGQVEVAPRSSIRMDLDFRPTEERSYEAFVRMRAAAECPEQAIKLTGAGVASVLSWEPAQVDCGFATPGVQVTREVTFTNVGNTDAELFDIATLNAAEFGVRVDDGVDPTRLTVPARGGTAVLTLWCKPAVLGPRRTELTFQTNLSTHPAGAVVVKAFGGGPDIELQPFPNLDFGKVAYFSDAAPPVFQKRKLRVMNVGTAPNPTNPPQQPPPGYLRLGRVDAEGAVIPDTYFTVTPLNAETGEGEVTVEMPAGYDAQVGLEARPGRDTAELWVKLTPQSVGTKQAEIRIFSNDPDEPEVVVTVSADVTVLPPCNYAVTPSTLEFGLISPPDYRDLGFTVKNNGTSPGEICVLSGLDVGPGTDPYFSLPDGPINSMELAPGASTLVRVRVRPQGMTPTGVASITGGIEFYLSSPTQPQRTVGLNAQLSRSCLTLAPDDLDLGTVQVGCSSATQTFNVYNTCSSPVTIQSIGVASAPAADPSCLSTTGCEFLMTSAPAVPSGGLTVTAGAAPLTFQVKYRPQDPGLDIGAVAIGATQDGTNVRYVVAMKGTGDAQGIHTDVFAQDANPKADVLLVVDNSSCSNWYQAALGTNFNSFIQYAAAAKVDYRIAVIHTERSLADYGQFVSGPAHPETVLTPTTVDLEDKFKAKVDLGGLYGDEWEADAALRALTAPLINSTNSGFLRDDATLAVVTLTDEPDHSNLSAGYYLDGFWNIKGFNRKTLFSFSAIASFDPTCPSQQDDGSLAFYVAQTNGVKESLCTQDWPKALQEIGKTAFGFRDSFFLTSAPDLNKGPIEVKIDGVTTPSTHPNGAALWSFDAVARSVRFAPLYAPQPGQTLAVSYHVTCYP